MRSLKAKTELRVATEPMWFCLSLVAACLLMATSTFAEGISVTQSIDRSEVAYEGEVAFEIELQWDGSQAAYRFDKPLDPYFSKLKIERFSSSISSTGTDPNLITTKKFRYTLVPTGSGVGRIDPVTISYATWPDSIPGELVTEALTVNISNPVPKELPTPIGWWVYLVGVIVLVSIGGFVVYRIRNKQPAETVKPPTETFLDQLTDLRKVSGGDLKKFQSGLYDLLATFLSERCNIDLAGGTDREITEALSRTDMGKAQKEKVAGWLVKAQADKFRPVVSAPGDTARLESEIREFFKKLK
ncbi:MAG: hypothetical protein KAT79_03945 [candidate division Zixibacteria bacterium]|nr:hypothetical protein [candidate division Zixibacteria bacterium]